MWLANFVGLKKMVDALLQGDLASAEVLLVTTFVEPALGDELATYEAIEASWPGYARQSAGAWDAADIDDTNAAFSYSSLMTFPVSGDPAGAIVYAYGVVLGTDLWWAESLDNRPVPAVGFPVTFKARFSTANVPIIP